MSRPDAPDRRGAGPEPHDRHDRHDRHALRLPHWLRAHPVRWALLVVTLAVASVYLVPRTDDALHAVHRLKGGSWGWLMVSLAAEIASLVAFSIVTRWLLERDSRPSFRRVFRLDLVTVALSHAVPVGSVAGSALGYELLEEEGVDGVQAGFVKVSQSLLSGLLLEVLLAFSLFLQLIVYGPSTDTVALTVGGGMLLVVVGGFAALLARRPAVIQSLAVRLLGWVPKLEPDGIRRVVGQLSERMQALLRRPARLAWVSAWSLGNWVFDLFALWAALRAFGTPPSPVLLTVAFCIAQVAAALPISPAGLGVVESSLVPLLTGFGTPANVAILGVLSWRVVNFWVPLPIGGLAYLSIVAERRRRHRVPQISMDTC